MCSSTILCGLPLVVETLRDRGDDENAQSFWSYQVGRYANRIGDFSFSLQVS